MSGQIHVCHITTIHPEKDMRIFHKECVSLANSGYRVTLIVGNGKTEMCNGVEIIGVPVEYDGFFSRMSKLGKAMLDAAINVDADIYQFHDPEFLRHSGKLKAAGKKVVFDSHEDVGQQIMSKHYIPKPIRKLVSWIYTSYEKRAMKSVSAVVGATDHIAEKFKSLHPEVIALRNYPLLSELPDEPDSTARKRQAVYVGGISRVRCAEEMIDMLDHTDIPLQLGGGFSPKTLEGELKTKSGWGKVNYRGYVGRSDIWQLYNECMVGLVLFKPEPNHLEALPNKMFEYMMASMPVVVSNFPMWQVLIDQIGCGVTVNPNDPKAIAKAIDELCADPAKAAEMGAKGRAAVLSKFNYESEAPKLVSLYQKLITS